MSRRDGTTIIGHEPFKKRFSLFKENTAHISTKNSSGISYARSSRTLRDGAFPGLAFPGTACQATIGVSLRDALATISQQPLVRRIMLVVVLGIWAKRLAGRGLRRA
jgi:hypothetical protein